MVDLYDLFNTSANPDSGPPRSATALLLYHHVSGAKPPSLRRRLGSRRPPSDVADACMALLFGARAIRGAGTYVGLRHAPFGACQPATAVDRFDRRGRTLYIHLWRLNQLVFLIDYHPRRRHSKVGILRPCRTLAIGAVV